jgi:hypothetical protein
MKYLVFLFLICISNPAFCGPAINQSVADSVNGDSTCSCNGLPANLPIVGLFHRSQWGTSLLQAFSIDDPKAQEECLNLKEELVKLRICH